MGYLVGGGLFIGDLEMKGITKLRLKLLEQGLTQREAARKVGIAESLMSLIVNGRFIPSSWQRKRISKILNVPEEQLFEKNILDLRD